MISNGTEAYQYVLRGLQKENAGTIETDDFRTLWDKAALNWVRQRWAEAELNAKRLEDIRTLIPAPLTIANSGATIPGGEVFNLPFIQSPASGVSHGYLFMLNCGLKLLDATTGQPIECVWPGGLSPARPLRRDAKYDNVRDPYWEPTPQECYWYHVGNTFRVLCGPDVYASEAVIEYVKYPVSINLDTTPIVDPDLHPQAMQEVADLAIRERLETIESRRFQTVAAEQSQIPK